MKRAIQKYSRNFGAVVFLALIAVGVGGYILSNQRVRFPWEASTFTLRAAFSTAQAVTPGQGQTVRVSGVRIGDISGVTLKDGQAIVTMAVDPQYKHLVHTNATALLRPKTGLKDMFIELSPGNSRAPVAKAGWTIPIANTLPDVNPDEIYSALDGDTRDYLRLLVSGAGQGLAGRGHDLQDVFRRFEPTHRDLARVTSAVAARHRDLANLIHSLAQLNTALAQKGPELASLIDASSKVFGAFASENTNISRAVGDLPGALRQTTATLGKVQRYADVLGPTARSLEPAALALNGANKATESLAKSATPQIAGEIRPFVRDARPIVRTLKAPAKNLAKATPYLTTTFAALNHLFNLLAYNQNGREDPSNPKRDEGYLYWLAWLDHNAGAVFGNADANGVFRPVTVSGTCGTLKQTVDSLVPASAQSSVPLAANAFMTLFDPSVCGI